MTKPSAYEGSPYFLEAYHELEGSTDRSAAIVGCTFIDDRLEKVLQRRFVADSTALKKVFGSQGCLWTLGNKIELGFLLGIYSAEAKSNFNAMASIRNKFAHTLTVNSFDDEVLSGMFKNITLYRKIDTSRSDSFLLPKPLPANASRRERFICSVQCAIEWLLIDEFRERWDLPEAFF